MVITLNPLLKFSAGQWNTLVNIGLALCGLAGQDCIGTNTLGFAPLGELLRVKVYTEDLASFCLERFAAGFGCLQPLIVGPMEFVAVLAHGAKDRECLAREPRESHDLHLHETAPVAADGTLAHRAESAGKDVE